MKRKFIGVPSLSLFFLLPGVGKGEGRKEAKRVKEISGGRRARSNLATIPFSSARCWKLLSLASLPFLLIRFPRQPLARPPCALFLPLPPTLFSRGSSREPRERVTPPPACALRGTLEVRKALLDERPRVRRRASKNDARSTLLPQETPNWHARSPLPCHYPLRSLFVTRLDSVSMRRRCSCQKEHWRPPGAGRAFRDSNFFQSREREERWKIQREAHLEQEAATSSAAPWVKRLEKAHSRALALLFSKLPRRRCFGAPPFHDVTAGIG